MSAAFVTLDGVSYATPDGRSLFDNLTLALGAERTGLVGRNGIGKSTLLRLILGQLTPASGHVVLRGQIGVMMPSPGPSGNESVATILGVEASLQRLRRIVDGQGSEGDLAEADWGLEGRLAAALVDVGLSGLDLGRPAASLSGGQLTRARMAGLLAAEPDLLILDEPTNNLDAEARELLTQILRRWKGGAIIVSHDRALLRGMDRIIELSGLGAWTYGGGYDLYAERKAAEVAAASRDLAVAEAEIARATREAQASVERRARRDAAGRRASERRDQPAIMLNAKPAKAQATAARERRISERLNADATEVLAVAASRAERLRNLEFDLPPSGLAPGKTVLAMEEVVFAYPAQPDIIKSFNLRIVGAERVAIVGPNGTGKTTLLKLAADELRTTSGRIQRGCQAAFLDQQTAVLGDSGSVVAAFRRINPAASENRARAALARFLFRGPLGDKPVASLSGGERLRAALASVLMGDVPPQLLILDEPTNHLDLDSIGAVEAALLGYDGALLVVSHDRDFLGAINIQREIALC